MNTGPRMLVPFDDEGHIEVRASDDLVVIQIHPIEGTLPEGCTMEPIYVSLRPEECAQLADALNRSRLIVIQNMTDD